MPNYDYTCNVCGITKPYIVPYESRNHPQACTCGGLMQYQFPLSQNWWGPIEYHDEGLGVDIHGRRERQEAMKAMGVVEAGDPKGGARNVSDELQIGIEKPTGYTLSDYQREQDLARRARDRKVISVVDEDGTRRSARYEDLPTIDEALPSHGKIKPEE